MTRGNEERGKALPHWRDIRAMCGFTAKTWEIQHEYHAVHAWVANDLWFVATQKDILDLYQLHGARCSEMYGRAQEAGSSHFYMNIVRKASTHFAQPEGVSVETRQLEWFALDDFGSRTDQRDSNRIERATRVQHKWRFLDASRMQGGLLREDVREAFEAIWLAGEWTAAYDYIDTLTLNLEMLQRED